MLFSKMDEDNNGCLDKQEFLNNLDTINPFWNNLNSEQKITMFECLAIRDSNKSKVYFYDFFNSIFMYNNSDFDYKVDITQMFYPIHGCFNYVEKVIKNIKLFEEEKHRIKKIKNKASRRIEKGKNNYNYNVFVNSTLNKIDTTINSLKCLFHLCQGARELHVC